MPMLYQIQKYFKKIPQHRVNYEYNTWNHSQALCCTRKIHNLTNYHFSRTSRAKVDLQKVLL